MSTWLIAAIGLVYLGVAADLALQKNFPMSITFIGYAIGNVGLCLATK